MQGANINMTTERTGETSLHLAARYARADAAKRLLDAGADANAQDNTGRTPLHAAVSSDAQGVFQILLRNRATNLNARMHDGTTSLILAARLAVEGMLEELVNADADINAADDHGKTALHWAAAVNNVDAVRVLLLHGANKDAQDDKDETPLFLAAREGSYGAARMLLENLANKEITDHMDRLPRDVACERMHMDIVRLLEECIRPNPVLNVVGTPGHVLLSSLLSSSSSSTKPKAKKRARVSHSRKDLGACMGVQCSSSKEPSSSQLCAKNVQQSVGMAQTISLNDGKTANFIPVVSCGDPHGHPTFSDCNKTSQNVGVKQQRPSLPTSPTHMAAMMAAHQQQNQFHSQYPTPPWQPPTHGSPQQQQQHVYLPETPESPGQWSSSSDCSASPLQAKAVLFI